MYQERYESDYRETLVRAYQIIREIYDDIASPIRQHQVRGRSDLYETDRCKAINIANTNRPLEEITSTYTNMHLLRSKDTTSHFFSEYLTSVLSIEAFKMSDNEYRNALGGFPVYDKVLGHNTQILLKDKIDYLKQELKASQNEYEFKLIFYIRYLQSVKYNLNVFGKFNPIFIDE